MHANDWIRVWSVRTVACTKNTKAFLFLYSKPGVRKAFVSSGKRTQCMALLEPGREMDSFVFLLTIKVCSWFIALYQLKPECGEIEQQVGGSLITIVDKSPWDTYVMSLIICVLQLKFEESAAILLKTCCCSPSPFNTMLKIRWNYRY